MNWYLDVLKKYAVFTGRARRQEFWMFALFNLIAAVILVIVDAALGTYPLLYGIYVLGVLLPSLAVMVRRLHDTGRSGWWILIDLVPLVGAIILIVFLATEGEAQQNAYGPNPKAAPTY
ncbi:DUF805 domain-containing protein [Streptomyces sp. NPDC094032]|uniref:DUF805 domain-containing protein n=1 Tax=Streptomyces sp. NPDC094032 TaxID=3155308 RepID=UPI00332B3804